MAIYTLDVFLEVAVVYLSSSFLAVYYEYKNSGIQQTVVMDAFFFPNSTFQPGSLEHHISHIYFII